MEFNRRKFGGVIETLPKNGSYAISIPSEEDRKEIASWFEGCGSLTKTLFYSPTTGEVANRVYTRSNNMGTYPAGCGLREKCLVSFSLNERGYVQVIVKPTNAAQREVEKQKVAVMATKQQMKNDAELFGVDMSKVQAAMFAQKFNLSFAEVNTAFETIEKPQQQSQQPKQNKSNQQTKPEPEQEQEPEPEFFGEGTGEDVPF